MQQILEGVLTVEDHDSKYWNAVVECDEAYDGTFFYAVKTVGVFCKPSCKSRTPLRKNIEFYQSTESAREAGHRPCKRCRPDLLDYQPSLELAKEAKELVERYYTDKKLLQQKMKALCVSKNHLSAVFKRHYGMTPLQYLNDIRIQEAIRMLSDTDIPIATIAFESGFNSLSAFYKFFKKQTNDTPDRFRTKHIKLQ